MANGDLGILKDEPVRVAQYSDTEFTLYAYDVSLDENRRETGRSRMDLTSRRLVVQVRDENDNILLTKTSDSDAEIEKDSDQVNELPTSGKGTATVKLSPVDTAVMPPGGTYYYDAWADGKRFIKKSRFHVEDGVYEPGVTDGVLSADFTWAEGDGFEVTFTAVTTGAPVVYIWDFGDGSSSTEQSPVHTYAPHYNLPEVGNYSVVKLTVVDATGETASKEEAIWPGATKIELGERIGPFSVGGVGEGVNYGGNFWSEHPDEVVDITYEGQASRASWRMYSYVSSGNLSSSDAQSNLADSEGRLDPVDDLISSTLDAGAYLHRAYTNNNDGMDVDYLIVGPQWVYARFSLESDRLVVSIDDRSLPGTDEAIESYSWDMGDGMTVEGPISSYLYGAAGTYTVTLTLTGVDGYVSTWSEEVTVTAARTATPNFEYNWDSWTAASVDVSFRDKTVAPEVPIVAWEWDFGDGSPVDNTQSPVHTYTTEGAFDVTLTTTDLYGDQQSVTLEVYTTYAFDYDTDRIDGGEFLDGVVFAESQSVMRYYYAEIPAGAFHAALRCVRPSTSGSFFGNQAFGQGTYLEGSYSWSSELDPGFSYPNPDEGFCHFRLGYNFGAWACDFYWDINSPLVDFSESMTIDIDNTDDSQVTYDVNGVVQVESGRSASSWLWDWDDGTTLASQTGSKTFTSSGTRRLEALVTDDTGVVGYSRREDQVSPTDRYKAFPVQIPRTSLFTELNNGEEHVEATIGGDSDSDFHYYYFDVPSGMEVLRIAMGEGTLVGGTNIGVSLRRESIPTDNNTSWAAYANDYIDPPYQAADNIDPARDFTIENPQAGKYVMAVWVEDSSAVLSGQAITAYWF